MIYEYSRHDFRTKNGVLFLNKKKFSGNLKKYDSVNLTYVFTKYCRGKKTAKKLPNMKIIQLHKKGFIQKELKQVYIEDGGEMDFRNLSIILMAQEFTMAR